MNNNIFHEYPIDSKIQNTRARAHAHRYPKIKNNYILLNNYIFLIILYLIFRISTNYIAIRGK